MAVLNAAARRSIPKSQMGLPGKSKPGKGASSGTYPIDTANRARNALSRISQYGSSSEKATVRAKVSAKYPDIGKGKNLGLKNAIVKKRLA